MAASYPPSAAPPSTGSPESSHFPNLDTITLDNIDLSASEIASVPEKIGFLKELGMNFGWGPTSTVQWLLEHVHVYSGLPWWGSIAATAVVIRLVLLPLFLKSADITTRQLALSPVTKPLMDRMKTARESQDSEAMAKAYSELMQIRKQAGLSVVDQFLPMVLQGVLGFGGYRLISAMTNVPVTGLQTGGFLWLQDLTLSDPYLILPAAMAGAVHVLVRLGGESGAVAPDEMGQFMRSFMLYAMPCVIVVTIGWMPGGLCVWFATGGAVGMAQSLLLRVPRVRSFVGIAPLYKPSKEEMEGGFVGSRGKTVDTRTSRRAGGKGEQTRPMWQAPNLHHSHSGRGGRRNERVIDVKARYPSHAAASAATASSRSGTPRSASSADDEMVQPSASGASNSIVQGARNQWDKTKEAFKGVQDMVRKQKVDGEKKRERQEKEAFKKAADAYEKRAQERKESGR